MDDKHESKLKFLNAALKVIRTKGYEATRIEDVCAEAGLTKGSFFHHFKGKEDMAVAAANHWSDMTGALFAGATYHQHEDPRDRVLAYVDFRRDLVDGDIPDYTCLVGTMVQEVHRTHPAIRNACEASITGHAATLEADFADAKAKYAPQAEWTPESMALFTQAVIQGAFILAKAKDDAATVRDAIGHLRRYIENELPARRS